MAEAETKTKKELNLNESILNIKVELQNSKLKMSGKNEYAGFNYFELADFLPKLNEIELKYGVNDLFTINTDKDFGQEYAILTLIKKEERQEYKIPFVRFETPLTSKGLKSMQDIQYLGALNTYYKRYLYMNAFGITDGDIIDKIDNTHVEAVQKKRNATDSQLTMLASLYTSEELQKAVAMVNKATINDLTVQEASLLISKRKAGN